MRFFKKIMYCFNKILDDYIAQILEEKPKKPNRRKIRRRRCQIYYFEDYKKYAGKQKNRRI